MLLGIALVGGFAPFSFFPLAIVAPAGLMWLIHGESGKTAARVGYLFGVGYFAAGVYWVYNSVHEFGQAPAAFAIALTLVFVLFLSLFPSVLSYLIARYKWLDASVSALLAIPSLWVLLEWVRGWVFTGFPWLQLGYSQTDTFIGQGVAPVLGVLGVSWFVMVIAVSAYLLVRNRSCNGLIYGFSIAVVIGLSLGLSQREWTQPVNDPIRVTMIQGNIAQENKWAEDWLVPTILRYSDLTRDNWDSDLIIWPEAALPGLYENFREPVLEPLAEEAREHNTDLITGMLYEVDGKVFNSVMTLGSQFGTYFKRHLVPFGEYIPFRNLISWLGDMVVIPSADVSPATEAHMLEAAGQKIAASVCYEDAYGAEMSVLLPEANLLVNVSNDAWFGDSLAPHQHLQIARMRSIEFGRVMLRTTNTGISAVIDHKGKILDRLPQFETATLTAEVQPRTGATLYANTANAVIVPLMSLLLLVGVLWSRRRH